MVNHQTYQYITYSYQWYQFNGNSFVEISGETNSMYTPTILGINYQCVVTTSFSNLDYQTGIDSFMATPIDWIVSIDPTLTNPGEIIGTFGHNNPNNITILLPILNNDDYTYYLENEPTCTTVGRCRYTWNNTEYRVFSFELEIPTLEHQYDQEWHHNSNSHWHECDCGEITDLDNHTPSDWIIDLDPTETTAGSAHQECLICGSILETKTIPPLGSIIEYVITEGANGSWNKDATIDYTIKVDGDILKFNSIKVNGQILSDDNFTITSGSTIITIKKEYLQTLTIGEYIIEIIFTDNSVATTLTIKETAEEQPENKGLSALAIVAIVLSSGLMVAIGGFMVFWIVIKKKTSLI